MYSLAVAGGGICVLLWVYLLFGRGAFWRIDLNAVPRMPSGEPSPPPAIAAIIPARNEQKVISHSVSSLLRQTYKGPLHLFVVDDGSDDDTAAAALAAARRCCADDRLTVVRGQPLSPGWTGKMWAVQQGIERASAAAPGFFLLTDADIVHAPDNLACLAAIAEAGGFDLASLMVKLRCHSLAEKLLIPPFIFFFFKLYPPRWVADPRHSEAAAAGGCMLIRPQALARAGGIAAIRNQIIDDCALAAAVKRNGGKVWLALTESAHSLRAYDSFAEIGHMISRTAFSELEHSPWLLMAAVVGLAVAYLLPPALLLSGRIAAAALGAIAWTLTTLCYLPMVRFYRLNPFWAVTLPLAAVYYMGATLHSAFKYWLGRGGEWKGRVQDPAGSRSSV